MNGVYGLVPVKSFRTCKSRLASILSQKEREQLGREFLRHTLDVVGQAIGTMVVVSIDPAALEFARKIGVHALMEDAPSNMNGALAQAARWAIGQGAASLVVVPTDLPLLTAELLRRFLCASVAEKTDMTIAPDRHDSGTNLLHLTPPRADAFRFGPASLAAYRALSADRGLKLQVHRQPELALDIDTPADFAIWEKANRTHTTAVSLGGLASNRSATFLSLPGGGGRA